MGRHDDLVQLDHDALATHYLDALGHALQPFEGLVLNLEVQLGGEAYAAHHAQGVVAEGDVGVKGRGDDAVLKVGKAVKRVDQLAEAVMVQADGHRVDGEVAPVLVVLQRAVLHDGLARVMAVALTAGADELHFYK